MPWTPQVKERDWSPAVSILLSLNWSSRFRRFWACLPQRMRTWLPPRAVVAIGEDFPRNPVGSGPFKLAWWLEDVACVMHRNEGYWDVIMPANNCRTWMRFIFHLPRTWQLNTRGCCKANLTS